MSADYSEIERRALALMSTDDVDFHTATASEMFGVPPDKVSPQQRWIAKEWNYGTAYGRDYTATGRRRR